MNKSLADSRGWITSAFKGQTLLRTSHPSAEVSLGSQQFGSEMRPNRWCASVCVIHTSCSFPTASVSSTRCVTAAPLRISAHQKNVSAQCARSPKLQPDPTCASPYPPYVCGCDTGGRCVCVCVCHLSVWLTGRCCRSSGAVPGPRCWKLSSSATWPREGSAAWES